MTTTINHTPGRSSAPGFLILEPALSSDNLTQPGAHKLAAQIQAYWLKRGCVVDTRVEPVGMTYQEANRLHRLHVYGAWAVRSDLGMYEPRKLMVGNA